MRHWKRALFVGLLLAAGMASGEVYKSFTTWRDERIKRFRSAQTFVHKMGPGYRITARADDDESCPPENDCYWYEGIDSQGQYDERIVYSGKGTP